MTNLKDELNANINQDSLDLVNKIDDDVVRKALLKMKDGKSDALYDFSSDCLTHGPPGLIPSSEYVSYILYTRMCTSLLASMYTSTNCQR